MAVQLFFIYCVLTVSKVKFTLHNDMALQICLFFTTLMIHLSILLNQLLNHVMHTTVTPLDALLKNIITQKKVTITGEITS